MAEVWYPEAIRLDGANAGYANGRNRMEVVKLHYTVGVNSTPIGLRGYYQFQLNRDGTIYQFAPVDAYCFDSGEWNDAGPGIEAEYHPAYHDPILNDEMVRAAAGLVKWLHLEHGFPLVKYDGSGRIGEFGGFRGFLDHDDLIQTDPHHDYWPEEAWAQIIGMIIASPVSARPRTDEDMIIYCGNPDGTASARALSGPIMVETFHGPPDPLYGVPPGVGEFARGEIPVRLVHPFSVAAADRAHYNALTTPAAPVVDTQAIVNAVVAAIPQDATVDYERVARAVADEAYRRLAS